LLCHRLPSVVGWSETVRIQFLQTRPLVAQSLPHVQERATTGWLLDSKTLSRNDTLIAYANCVTGTQELGGPVARNPFSRSQYDAD